MTEKTYPSTSNSIEYTSAQAAADIFDQLLILRELAVGRKLPMLAYLIDMAALEARDEAKKENAA